MLDACHTHRIFTDVITVITNNEIKHNVILVITQLDAQNLVL